MSPSSSYRQRRGGGENRGLRAGADDYLVKPSQRASLARVETNLKLAGTRQAAARILREEAKPRAARRGGHRACGRNRFGTRRAGGDGRGHQAIGRTVRRVLLQRVDDKGESYTLYTLSGAPREAFATFPMPRNTESSPPPSAARDRCVPPTSPRIRATARARPIGMPPGHLPVRSYLAVPVVARSGEVLGGLFFGHSEAGVFGERAERIVAAIASQAAIAIDKARLYRAAQDGNRAAGEGLRRPCARASRASSERSASARRNWRRRMPGCWPKPKSENRPKGVSNCSWTASPTTRSTCSIRTASSPTGTPAPSASRATRADEIIGQHFSRFYTEEDRAAGAAAAGARDRRATKASSKPRAGACARTARASGPAS